MAVSKIDLTGADAKLDLNYNTNSPLPLKFWEDKANAIIKDLTGYIVTLNILDSLGGTVLLTKAFTISTPTNGEATLTIDGTDWDLITVGNLYFNVSWIHTSWTKERIVFGGDCKVINKSQ